MLTDAAINGKVDHLVGIKENVLIGNLIPAGTGMKKYRSVVLDTDGSDLREIAEKAREEAAKAEADAAQEAEPDEELVDDIDELDDEFDEASVDDLEKELASILGTELPEESNSSEE